MRALLISLAVAGWFGPRLNAVETAVPIGIVFTKQQAFFDLVLRNESTEPLLIQKIQPHCECVTVLKYPATVAAGGVVRIPCSYRTTNPGAIQTIVDVIGADATEPRATFQVTGFAAEKPWLVSAAEVIALPPGQTVLVDVRSAGEFSRAHPQQALNLPLFSLKARANLRQQRVVLIDEGFAPEVLLAEVQKLRAQGFDNVSMLNGGLVGWVRAGGAVEGLGRSSVELSTISAGKFARSSATSPWLCIEVGGPAKNAKRVPSVVNVANLDELAEKLTQEAWPVSGGASFQPVLIAIANVQDRAQIEKRFGQNRGRQLYYLEGGFAALETYQAEQAALVRHSEEIFISRPEPSQVVSRPAASGRCGSCSQ
jgi:rhodanese-related sulfurtransferase